MVMSDRHRRQRGGAGEKGQNETRYKNLKALQDLGETERSNEPVKFLFEDWDD